MSAYTDAGVVDAGEPMAQDPETLHEMQQIAEDKLELLAESLVKTRDKWIAAKIAQGVERRWIEDMNQYLGKDHATETNSSMMDTVRNGGYPERKDKAIHRSTVFVNITRPKTNAVESRLANMLYPSDDLAWGISPTPNPSLTMQAMQEAKKLSESWNQQPEQMSQQAQAQMANPTPAQVPGVAGGMQPAASQASPVEPNSNPINMVFDKTPAQAQIEEAEIAAKAMQKEIEDAHIECDFNAEARKMLHEVAVLGSGVLKGPIVVNRVAKVWQKTPISGAYILAIEQESRPATEMVSVWDFYPDPTCGTDIHRGKGVFERKRLTGKQVRELVGQPGYLDNQISKVLEKGPVRSNNNTAKDLDDDSVNEPMYEGWEYWGEFDPEDLRACGVDVPEGSLKVVSGCIIIVNDIVVKGFVNPLECGSLPYDMMVLEKDSTSVWGYGVPFLCRPAQRVLNAAWRQMMDNAGISVGPMVVVKRNMISPADGQWQVRGNKVWNCLDDSADVREAFHAFDMPNHSDEFQNIINLAMMFADEESSVPKIAQGDTKSDSVGVTTIQMNSANVVLGRLVKQYDDMITKPHIRRYYDFFMAYSGKDDIKGDFQINARGSSVLLVRDQQVQSLMQFGSFQSTPLAPMVYWHKWLKEVLKAQHLNPVDLMKPDAEIEKIVNAPPPPNPEQVKQDTVLKAAQIKSQTELQATQIRQQGENAYVSSQEQMARDNAIARLKELELKRDIAILQYATQEKTSLNAVKADLAKTAMIEQTKRQVEQARLEQQALEGDKARMTPNQTGAQ